MRRPTGGTSGPVASLGGAGILNRMGDSDSSLDHQGLEVLPPEECWKLIGSSPVGRISFVDEGSPMILPVNHAVVGHRVVFRTARGTLLHEALMGRPVAFEVDGFDEAERSGWSVVLRGLAGLADDEDSLDGLGLRPWADAVDRNDWVSVIPDEVSGRRIT